MSRLLIPGLLGLALISGACRLGEDGGVVGTVDRGATGRIEVITTSVAGGQVMTWTQVVDSARGTLEARACRQSVVGDPCVEVAPPVTSAIHRAQLDSIFRVVTAREFRRVRSTYRRPAGVVPPDAAHVRLEVTVQERTRVITWERNSSPPRILTDLACLISTGGSTSFGLCAVIS
jgi:hypothetical protein